MNLSFEDINKAPSCNPYPADVGIISMIISLPQSEHLSFNTIVDISGLASNSSLNIFRKVMFCIRIQLHI
jgi:hypothetical protein